MFYGNTIQIFFSNQAEINFMLTVLLYISFHSLGM